MSIDRVGIDKDATGQPADLVKSKIAANARAVPAPAMKDEDDRASGSLQPVVFDNDGGSRDTAGFHRHAAGKRESGRRSQTAEQASKSKGTKTPSHSFAFARHFARRYRIRDGSTVSIFSRRGKAGGRRIGAAQQRSDRLYDL